MQWSLKGSMQGRAGGEGGCGLVRSGVSSTSMQSCEEKFIQNKVHVRGHAHG